MLAVCIFFLVLFKYSPFFLHQGDLSFVLSNAAGETHCHFGITKR